MSESETSKNEQDKLYVQRLAQGYSMLDQLLEDIEDDGFWTDPDWDEKNPRDENGMPIKD